MNAAKQAERLFDPRLFSWIGNGLLLAAAATALILLLAIFLSYANRLLQSDFARLVAGIAQSGYAMPGLVIAVGLLMAIANFSPLIAQTVLVLVLAYTVRFLAVGYQSINTSLTRISPAMDASARSLGRGVVGVWVDVHWPLLRRAIFSGALLVFVDCFKELQTTLVLRPLNFDERLADAAVPCLIIVAISVMPVLLLWKAATHRSGSDQSNR
jgi:iron(III) transport system permease protein